MADDTVKKLKRSALAHYLDPAFDTSKDASVADWFLVGKDVEDMSINLNPSITTKKNILDENSVSDEGYEPSADVDTYYADPSDGAFYEKLKAIAMDRLTGDACKTRVLEVLVDRKTAPFDAWVEDVVVKPQSYGGAQGGVRIPYQIAFCGNRQKGTVTLTDKKPTFTVVTQTASE